jgi:peptide-methionine (S)-S-oxide reductase
MTTPRPRPERPPAPPIAAFALLVGLTVAVCAGWATAPFRKAPAPAYDPPPAKPGLQTAVLAGGCFWGMQGVFEHVRGVRQVLAGYAGGSPATAQYETVSTGTTGHAESIRIVFDPGRVSYGAILRIYFSVATDPTQRDAQYPDQGPQYRGEIFTLDATQQAVARRYIAQLGAARFFNRPIVTRVDPFVGFYPAEAYHQDYLIRHPDAAYIAAFDLPKVAALRSLFADLYRADPVRAP